MSDHVSRVLLAGAGPMAADYARVLAAENVAFTAVGRGAASATAFREKTGVVAATGGVAVALERGAAPEIAIVAVGAEALSETAVQLLQAGARRILLEKPGGLDAAQVRRVRDAAALTGAKVLLAYNRRFYASTRRARELLLEDGGASSFHFEFTEWSSRVAATRKAPGIKEAWLLANSSHVIDLAFFLGGEPAELSCLSAGSLAWHPPGSAFVGCGRASTGAVFSYHADWKAPGRWGVELMTVKRRLVLRPIEELCVQPAGSLALEKLPVEDADGRLYKPGLLAEVRAFLAEDDADFLTIDGQLRRIERVYEPMAHPETRA